MDYWKEKTLGDVLTLQRGFDLSVSKRINGPYPVIASTGPVGTNEKPMVKGPGVVIGRSGSIGGGQYIKSDFWPLNTTLWVKDYKSNDVLFCYYLLKSLDFSRYNAGSGVPTLNRNHIHPIPVKIPPLPEQHAIAQILSSLDDKIELNTQMNETLEAMAQALFKSWFVDFDPVRAKMAGREPEGMDAETAALFPDEMEVVDGREVPKGWEIKPLSDIFELNPRLSLKKGESATYLDMKNMPTSGHRPLEINKRIFGSGTKFQNGDTLFARITPCLENGKTAFVDFLSENEIAWGSTEYIVLRPKNPIPKEFGYFLARSEYFRNFAIRNMSGTSGRQRVQAKAFDTYMVFVPDKQTFVAFGKFVHSIMAVIRTNDEQSHTLAAIRDTLLPKLIAGEIRIDNPEQFLSSEAISKLG